MTMPPTTLVLGIGNTLLSDEGAGIEVIRRLADAADIPGAIFLDGGTLSFTLAGVIADHRRLIVVDAAAMGKTPGSVGVFEGEDMDRRLSGKGKSVHEVSLKDLMDMARLTDSVPSPRALVGIEPAEVDWGDGLTPAVAAAVPEAMAAVRQLIARWDLPPT
jgi:hydrogenase maturation protease